MKLCDMSKGWVLTWHMSALVMVNGLCEMLRRKVKRLSIAIIFTLVTQAAFSDPFRGAERGDVCEGILEHEKSLNSTKIDLSRPTWLVFQGDNAGYNARILYVCKSGLLESQSILMEAQSHDEAMMVFHEIKQELSVSLGHPYVDTTEFSNKEIEELKKNDIYDPYFIAAAWKQDGTRYMITVRQDKSKWLIDLSQTARGRASEIEYK